MTTETRFQPPTSRLEVQLLKAPVVKIISMHSRGSLGRGGGVKEIREGNN